MTSVGFWTASISFAAVKVFPVPVAPSSTWCFRPASMPSTSEAIAVG